MICKKLYSSCKKFTEIFLKIYSKFLLYLENYFFTYKVFKIAYILMYELKLSGKIKMLKHNLEYHSLNVVTD